MRKIVSKRIRRNERGVNLAADVNVVIATGEDGDRTHTVTSMHQRVGQRQRRDDDRDQTSQQDQEER